MGLATIIARSTNSLFRANEKMTEVKHMLSLDKECALEDPNTELYQTSIRSFAVEGIRGFTKAEYGEVYRLMSGMSVTKTSVFSEDPNVRTCRSTTVTKTLVIPVIDSLSITEYETKDGKLVRVNNKPGFSTILHFFHNPTLFPKSYTFATSYTFSTSYTFATILHFFHNPTLFPSLILPSLLLPSLILP